MSYPKQILPNQDYKLIDSDVSKYYLIRHTDTNDPSELLDSSGVLQAIYVCSPREHIADLSCSLLGIFEKKFTEIEIIGFKKQYYIEYCNPDAEVEIPTENESYLLNKKRGYFIIPIKESLNLEVTYSRTIDGNKTSNLVATCIPEHSPVRWNYWHFSIRWHTPEGKLHNLPMKNWIRTLCTSARHIIQQLGKINSDLTVELPKELYLRT